MKQAYRQDDLCGSLAHDAKSIRKLTEEQLTNKDTTSHPGIVWTWGSRPGKDFNILILLVYTYFSLAIPPLRW